MDPTDEHIRSSAERLRAHVATNDDTDAAWRELLSGSGRDGAAPPVRWQRRSVRWISAGVAAALVAAAVVAIVVIRDHGERIETENPVVTSVSSTSTAVTAPVTATVAPSTTSPTTAPPTTAA